ncbi:MAG: carbohydrate ABC transporter substrate-binding protein [Erysipelotrichaceae bacterium]|nr:carbohydrate ABC transporter substrate-binding protein [Erysipelotrichaceae bacterium]
MKKKLSCIVSMILICISLCGCHGSKESSLFVLPESFDETKQYEITFWAKNDTNINQVNVYKKAIKDFEEIYPNITVSLKLYTDYSRIYNDVITNISTNTTPNVCITYPDHIATYMTGNDTVVCLDELLTDEDYGLGGSQVRFDSPEKDEVVDEFLNECIIKGKYYALPFMRSTEALYINKTYVDKLGYEIPDVVTWEWIFEVSEAATEKDPDGNYVVNGQKIMIPFIYKSTDNMMISMLKQLNAPYSEEDGTVLIFNDTTKEILYDIAKHTAKGAFSTFKISSYPANFLNAGQCIFAIDSTAGATWMGSKAPLLDIPKDQIVDFETIVRPIPQYDISDIKMISQGPSLCIFNKTDPQEVLASWLFAQYLLTNDVQIAYGMTEGYIPVTQKAHESAEYQDYLNREGEDDNIYYNIKIEASRLLLENTEHTFVTPVFNGSASLRDAAGSLIENTCKSVNRKETIDDAYFDALFEKLTSLYHLDQISAQRTKKDLGPLPPTSVALLGSLGAAWLLIGAYTIISYRKDKGIK